MLGGKVYVFSKCVDGLGGPHRTHPSGPHWCIRNVELCFKAMLKHALCDCEARPASEEPEALQLPLDGRKPLIALERGRGVTVGPGLWGCVSCLTEKTRM